MTYDEYWHGDPYLVKFYHEAHMKRIEMRNQELWLQGLYIHNAFSVVMSNAFAKKGSKPQKYLEEPIRITPMSEAEKRAEEEKKIAQTKQRLERLYSAWKEQNNG